jgi:hypothetical protein
MNCGVVLEREPRTLRVKTRLFGRSLQTLILRRRRDGCSCVQFSHGFRELGCGSLVLVQHACLLLAVQLRAALTAAREARIAAGWLAEDIVPAFRFFFASRDGNRVRVAIERMPPRNRLR